MPFLSGLLIITLFYRYCLRKLLKEIVLVIGGYDVDRVKKLNYGYSAQNFVAFLLFLQ